MPGNALLRRLGIERPTVVERATEAADSGFWLALRVAPDVTSHRLREFLDHWADADLASITDVVVPVGSAGAEASMDDRFAWFTELQALADDPGPFPVIPAAAKGAEALCRGMHRSVVALDEMTAEGFIDPCFSLRAEREKSFVRCAKALLAGAADQRVDRVVLWTRSQRVLASCRSAARGAGPSLAGRYEFCLPESERAVGERLLIEGETVRVWFPIDRIAIDRAVAR